MKVFEKLINYNYLILFLFIGITACVQKAKENDHKSAYGLKKLQEINKKDSEISDNYLFLIYQKKLEDIFEDGPVTLKNGHIITEDEFTQRVNLSLVENSHLFASYYEKELKSINYLLSKINKDEIRQLSIKNIDGSTKPIEIAKKDGDGAEKLIVDFFVLEAYTTDDIFRSMYFRNYKPNTGDVLASIMVKLGRNDDEKIDYNELMNKVNKDIDLNSEERKAVEFLKRMDEERIIFLDYLLREYQNNRMKFLREIEDLKIQLLGLSQCLKTIEPVEGAVNVGKQECGWLFDNPSASLSAAPESDANEITSKAPDSEKSNEDTYNTRTIKPESNKNTQADKSMAGKIIIAAASAVFGPVGGFGAKVALNIGSKIYHYVKSTPLFKTILATIVPKNSLIERGILKISKTTSDIANKAEKTWTDIKQMVKEGFAEFLTNLTSEHTANFLVNYGPDVYKVVKMTAHAIREGGIETIPDIVEGFSNLADKWSTPLDK